MTEESIRSDFIDIRVYFNKKAPYLLIPLKYSKIVESKESAGLVSVDGNGRMVVNGTSWDKAYINIKRGRVFHACLHLAFGHYYRGRGFREAAWNVAACAKVNSVIHGSLNNEISADKITLGKGEITMDEIAKVTKTELEDLNQMSVEEIARLLEEVSDQALEKMSEDDLIKALDNYQEIEEGEDGGDIFAKRDKEETKRVLTRMRNLGQQAGNMPAEMDRAISEVIEVKPPWTFFLRSTIDLHEHHDTSFAYVNRRNDELAGDYGYRYDLFNLVDTSGSIDENTLKFEVGLVKHHARNGTVLVMSFDAKAYELMTADSPTEVASRIAKKMKGGGGTEVGPALAVVEKKMRPGDGIVILTDGDIFDLDNPMTKQLAATISKKAGFAALGYTRTPAKLPGFQSFFLDMKLTADGS